MSDQSTATSVTIPPPVLGWNTRDPISEMDPKYAVEMENFFPAFGTVDLRNGYRYFAEGSGAGTEIVIGLSEYYLNGDRYLIGCTLDAGVAKIYDFTAGGAGTDITYAAGPPSQGKAICFQQFKNIIFMSDPNTPSGTSLLWQWNGTGTCTLTGYDTGLGAGSVFLPGAMTVYKSRFYMLQGGLGNVTKFYYSDVNAIAGTMKSFDFQGVLSLGGSGLFIGRVTRAKDFTEDELFCIITDQGEVLLYSGDAPEFSSWSLIGRYQIPRPLGVKAFFYIGPNLCVITSQGVIPMSEIMGGNATGKYIGISDPIQSEFTSAATTALFTDRAWCGINYPRGNYCIANIPIVANETSHQYVMNTQTQAWAKFTGQDAFCWALFNDELYFGGTFGKVFKADNGYFDEDPGDLGEVLDRNIKLRPAYNYFGDPSKYKQFVEARPVMYQSEGMQLTMDADLDYANTPATQEVTPDNSDASYKIYRPRVGLNGIGKSASIRIDQTVATKRMSIQAIEVLFNDGALA